MVKYRVWVHPMRGDDYYYSFTSKEKAKRFAVKNKNAEKVVYLTKGRFSTGSEKPIPLKEIKYRKVARRSSNLLRIPKFKFF